MTAAATRAFVARRADFRCEYCHLPQSGYEGSFNVDHIIAVQHGGVDDLTNLALCCPRCNRKKGPNLSGIDPTTGAIVSLFHPRDGRWADHFAWDDLTILGITPTARATIAVLGLNEQDRMSLRRALAAEGLL